MSVSRFTVESSTNSGQPVVTEKQHCHDSEREESLAPARENRFPGASSDEAYRRTSPAGISQTSGYRRPRTRLDATIAEFESDTAVTRRKRTDVKTMGDDSSMSSLEASRTSDVFHEEPKQYRRPQRSVMPVSDFESNTAMRRRRGTDVTSVGDDSSIWSGDVSLESGVYYIDQDEYTRPDWTRAALMEFDNDDEAARRKRAGAQSSVDDRRVSSSFSVLSAELPGQDPNQSKGSSVSRLPPAKFQGDAASARRSRTSVNSKHYERMMPSSGVTQRLTVLSEDPNQSRRSTVGREASLDVKRHTTGARKQFEQQPSGKSVTSMPGQELRNTSQACQDLSSPLDAFLKSDNIQKLDLSNFSGFIQGMEKALVMFYLPESRDTLKPASEFSKAAERPRPENHAFAAVDCSADTRLCVREKAINLPMLKLYSNGFELSTINDMRRFQSDQMRMLVEMTPVLDQPRQALANVYSKRP